MSIMSGLSKRAQSVPTRAAFLIIVLLVLACVYILVELNAHKQRLAQQVENVTTQVNNLAVFAESADEWTQRAGLAEQAKTAWLQKRWIAETPGIAAANGQTYLQSVAQNAGMENVRQSVSSDPLVTDHDELLRFELLGIGSPDTILTVLTELSLSEKSVIVTEFSAPIRTDRRTRFSVSGFFPYVQSSEVSGSQP